jgi:hypothetical protein
MAPAGSATVKPQVSLHMHNRERAMRRVRKPRTFWPALLAAERGGPCAV